MNIQMEDMNIQMEDMSVWEGTWSFYVLPGHTLP